MLHVLPPPTARHEWIGYAEALAWADLNRVRLADAFEIQRFDIADIPAAEWPRIRAWAAENDAPIPASVHLYRRRA